MPRPGRRVASTPPADGSSGQGRASG
jgi:hypothetical protein